MVFVNSHAVTMLSTGRCPLVVEVPTHVVVGIRDATFRRRLPIHDNGTVPHQQSEPTENKYQRVGLSHLWAVRTYLPRQSPSQRVTVTVTLQSSSRHSTSQHRPSRHTCNVRDLLPRSDRLSCPPPPRGPIVLGRGGGTGDEWREESWDY